MTPPVRPPDEMGEPGRTGAGGTPSSHSLVPDHQSFATASQFASEAALALWGCGDLASVFTGDRRVVPWPSAARLKHQPLVPLEDVARLLAGPPALADLDPRVMFATQTFCVASHVAYYLSPVWARTGRTSADAGKASNRYPLVWVDDDGRQVLLGGHHRSLAALIEGRPVRCRVLRPESDDAVAVLPLLLAGPSAGVDHLTASDPEEAAATIGALGTALVPDLSIARATLVRLGFADELISDRIEMAGIGRCRLSA